MIKRLQTYLSILLGVLIISNVALAQVQRGKSRLDIGKKPTQSSKSPVQKLAFISQTMPSEIRLNKPSALNQYYRNALLNNSTKSTSNKNTQNEINAYSVAEGNNEKFFSNEKITVSNIYPNPANDYATIDYNVNSGFSEASISFYNLLGHEVAIYELDKFDKKLKVQTTNWDSGVYLYQLVVDGKKVATKKLLVRHN